MSVPVAGRLVGRDPELHLAASLVRGLRAGHASTLVIEGEAGIGKTRLVQSLMADARSCGVVVQRGEAHPFERTRPFGAVVEALDLRRRSSDPRRATVGRLLTGDGEPSAVAPRGVADLRHRIVEEILDLVEAVCAESPVLLVLEDLHWADTSTLLAFRSMARGLVDVPLLLVGSLRPAPRSAELDQLVEDTRLAGAHMVRLQPLSDEEIDVLARGEVGMPPGPTLAAALAKAGGNPLWAVEILRALSAEGQLRPGPDMIEVVESELPESLRELVVRRLRYLPEAALQLLQLAAVLGDTVSTDDLVAVARRPAADVMSALTEAFRARLLGDQGDVVVFRHQVVHDAIYQDMPRTVRRAMHRDAASALADAGVERLRVADHLVLGAARGDLEAVRWLREAAHDALAGGPAVAVELLRRAESLLPGGHPDADLVTAELVEAFLRAGNVAEAAARAEAVLDRRHRVEADVPLRLTLVSALSLQNRAAELVDRAESTLVHATDLTLADQSLVLAQASYGRTFSGDIVGGEQTARRALELAERSGDAAMFVWSSTTLSVAVKSQGRYGEALELAYRAVERAVHPPNVEARLRHPHFFLGMTLSDSDRPEDARAAFDKALDEYDELGSTWLLPDTQLMAAETRFIVGEWDDAVLELEDGLRVASEHGQQILIAQSYAYLAVMKAARGDRRGAQLALAHVDAELDSDTPRYGAQLVAYAAAVLAEDDDDAARAFELLLRFWDRDVERDNRYYHRYLAPPLVRLALAAENHDVARRVTEVVEAGAALAPEVPTVQSAARRCRGLVTGDADTVVEAVELARSGPRVLDHATVCEDAAALLAGAGRSDEAKALLYDAVERYREIGARGCAARADAALRRLGVRRGARGPRRRSTRGWESLTATELAVSRHVAEGLTNREVAKRLHVSPHTVNTHLRHVFEKLAVSNRAGLAAIAARHEDPAS